MLRGMLYTLRYHVNNSSVKLNQFVNVRNVRNDS